MASVPLKLRRHPAPPVRPVRLAALLAAVHVGCALVWLVISARFSASISESLPQLENRELIVGAGFVLVTALAFFAICTALLQSVRRQEEQIAREATVLAEAERATLAGVFASAVAHDVNNALTVGLAAAAELNGGGAPGVDRPVCQVVESLEAIHGFTTSLLELSRDTVREPPTAFDLAEMLRTTVDFASHHRTLRECNVRLETDRPSIPFTGRVHLVRRALLNMILNSAEATEGRGTIVVGAESAEPGVLRLRVDDDGPGIPAAQRRVVLRPFFTTKPKGTGIGMLSVVACARDHGGKVVISDSPQGGARVEMWLRKSQTAA